jgi:hypothetical protein
MTSLPLPAMLLRSCIAHTVCNAAHCWDCATLPHWPHCHKASCHPQETWVKASELTVSVGGGQSSPPSPQLLTLLRGPHQFARLTCLTLTPHAGLVPWSTVRVVAPKLPALQEVRQDGVAMQSILHSLLAESAASWRCKADKSCAVYTLNMQAWTARVWAL